MKTRETKIHALRIASTDLLGLVEAFGLTFESFTPKETAKIKKSLENISESLNKRATKMGGHFKPYSPTKQPIK